MPKYYIAVQVKKEFADRHAGDPNYIRHLMQDIWWHGHHAMKGIEDKGNGLWWIAYDDLETARRDFDTKSRYTSRTRFVHDFEHAEIVNESGAVVEALQLPV
ncbi:hypothetical protein JDV02_003895 [Purpureocillium takamizusanense]|uniref:Uncharacterized protein n=1 Tax=Purpureocillium takamizusanense TaxID=2060973 RepID=A0A9Q8QDC3_9HYPO|nr:uncharacterized protein JDV02_003895 [Purpureocillium takamizusanense]UNI17565.1 hypothetical protein JDV02_003895 [Purpureocillium takamizusanense]